MSQQLPGHEATIFESRLGYFAAVIRRTTILKVIIGLPSTKSIEKLLTESFDETLRISTATDVQSLTLKKFQNALSNYLLGRRVDFSKFDLDLEHLTSYQKRVANVVRSIPYGETLSYSQVAELSGSPRAARAVGTVMANNRFPIVIPCHRVVAASGKLGGFSAPGGLSLKQSLLDLEGSRK